MKRFLAGICASMLVSSAMAADIRAPQPVAPPPPVFSWTGFYAGIQAGGQWGQHNFVAWGVPGYIRESTASVGAFVGANYQIPNTRFVVGAETDFNYLTSNPTVNFGYGITGTTSHPWEGSTRARLGFAPIERVLVYGTAGVAYNTGFNATLFAPKGFFETTGNGWGFGVNNYVYNYHVSNIGWTAGAGLEYMITPHITSRVEWLYTSFGAVSQQAARVGIGYKF